MPICLSIHLHIHVSIFLSMWLSVSSMICPRWIARHWNDFFHPPTLWAHLWGVLAHWTYTAAYSRTQMIALWWKIKACVVGQVHPIAMIMGMKESDPEVWWPALAGVAFWHIGNMITSAGYYFDPPASSNNQEGMMSHKNLQTTEAPRWAHGEPEGRGWSKTVPCGDFWRIKVWFCLQNDRFQWKW